MYAEGDERTLDDFGIPVSLNPIFWTNQTDNVSLAKRLYIAMYLREQVLELDKMWDHCGFKGLPLSGSKKGHTLGVSYVTSGFRSTKKSGPMTESTVGVTVGAFVKHTNHNAPFWDQMYELFSVEDLDGSESLFVDGMSRRQEQALMDAVISGDLVYDGKYGQELTKWVSENVWHNIRSVSAETDLRNLNPDAIKEGYLKFYDGVEDVVAIDSDGYYTIYDDDDDSFVYSGQVCVMGANNIGDDWMPLAGYSGELVSGSKILASKHAEYEKERIVRRNDAIFAASVDAALFGGLGSVDLSDYLEKEEEPEFYVSGVPMGIATEGRNGLWYDSEFSILEGDLTSKYPSTFASNKLFLEFSTTDHKDVLSLHPLSSIRDGLKYAYMLSECGLFGPIRVPAYTFASLDREAQQLSRTI